MAQFHWDSFISKFQPVRGCILFLVPAADSENAQEVSGALGGAGLVALLAIHFTNASSLSEEAIKVKESTGSVSLALGGASYALEQAEKVIEAALLCEPDHINQPFIKSGVALGRLVQSGFRNTVVNALVISHQEEDWVAIQTGSASSDGEPQIHTRDIANIVKGIGIHSLKVDFNKHPPNQEWLEHVAREVSAAGIRMIELSSGINQDNVLPLIDLCLNAGIPYIMPHVFSALLDDRTGKTRPDAVRQLIAHTRNYYE